MRNVLHVPSFPGYLVVVILWNSCNPSLKTWQNSHYPRVHLQNEYIFLFCLLDYISNLAKVANCDDERYIQIKKNTTGYALTILTLFYPDSVKSWTASAILSLNKFLIFLGFTANSCIGICSNGKLLWLKHNQLINTSNIWLWNVTTSFPSV